MESQFPKRKIWQSIFLTLEENRLRAGWRLMLHSVLIMVLIVIAGIVIFIPVGLLKINFSSPLALLANQLTMLFAITTATFLARRFLDKRSIRSLGLTLGNQAGKDILAGISIAFFLMGLIFSIEIGIGWTKFEGFSWQADSTPIVVAKTILWMIVFLIVGWQEELLSRGYQLQTLQSGLGLFWAVVLSSSIFGAMHIFNPSANWISTLGIILAGLFLTLPFLLTHQLWLSIGLHIGWNFFEGVVFGFPVSGLETYHLLRHTVSGPELWTGGAFGPEAGLLLIPALLLGSWLVLLYSRSNFRNNFPIKVNN